MLKDGYNAVGLSQGGLLLKGIAELCPAPRLGMVVKGIGISRKIGIAKLSLV